MLIQTCTVTEMQTTQNVLEYSM